jgi:hypothetical protein
MSNDLPLWNNDKSDVLPQYRIQYGHVLIKHADFEDLIKLIKSIYKLKKTHVVYNYIEMSSINQKEQGKYVYLSDDSHWHFIMAIFYGDTMVIYAPHFLFYNNINWMRLSKKISSYLFVFNQIDINLFHWTIFHNGELYCNVHKDITGIHKSIHAPVEISFNNRVIYTKEDDTKELKPDLIDLIKKDIILTYDSKKGFLFKSTINKDKVENPIAVRHIVFSCK